MTEDPPLMKCGCVSNCHRINKDGTKTEGCLVHECFEISKENISLVGRNATCSYFGKMKPNRRYCNDECNYGCRGKQNCECGSVPSSLKLAFFKHRPNLGTDEFFCGCFGWD
jgi:hypothetical protein